MSTDPEHKVTQPVDSARRYERGDTALRLLVITADSFATHPLPERGEVTVGRAQEATIVVDDPSVSRVHVCLTVGEALTVRDLGSSNGTRVRDERLEAGDVRAIVPGDVVDVGASMLVVQAVGAVPPVSALPARAARTDEAPRGAPSTLVVEDESMRRLHRLVERIAAGTISVLLLGETGVGKEVFAELVHRRSPRAEQPFLRLNCAALTETLLESELFGHEKGSFTGAVAAKPGLLETADGGTVFLDEVGELPLTTQVKLLRVLEERRVTRVGGLKPRDIDVRVVAATNRDLEAEILRGTFRQDLYFRLNGVSVVIPPLRERLAELDALARLYIAEGCRRAGRSDTPALSPEARAALRAHPWPGNIRELRNMMERAVLLCGDGDILPEHLSTTRGALSNPPPAMPVAPQGTPASTAPTGSSAGLRDELDALERQRILDALERCAGNQTRAAQMLGMSRRTLVSRLGSYGVPRPRKP